MVPQRLLPPVDHGEVCEHLLRDRAAVDRPLVGDHEPVRGDPRQAQGGSTERLHVSRQVAVPGTELRQVVIPKEQDSVVGKVEAQVSRGVAGGHDGDRPGFAEPQLLPVGDRSPDRPRLEMELLREQLSEESVPFGPDHAVPGEERLERLEGRGVRGRGPGRRVRQAGQEREVILMVVRHHDRRDPVLLSQPFDLRRIGAGVHEDAAPVRHVQGVRVRVPPVLPALNDPNLVRQPMDHPGSPATRGTLLV